MVSGLECLVVLCTRILTESLQLLSESSNFSFLDYKVERVTKKMSEDKKEYDLKMQEYAQLLDIRADRIRVTITRTYSLIKLFVVVVVDVVCLMFVCLVGWLVVCLFVCLFVCFSLVLLILQFTIIICSGKTRKQYLQLKTVQYGGYKYKVSSVFICLLSASEDL